MTETELNEIIDKSNFYVDSENEYDMKILEVLKEQLHNCGNCNNADYNGSGRPIYCLEHSYYMQLDNCCRDWEEA